MVGIVIRSLRLGLVVLFVVTAGCTGAIDGASSPAAVDSPTATPASATAGSSATPTASAGTGNGTLEVHFVNVGQSVSTLVVSPAGETMLVDSGDFRDDGEYVLGYLRDRGIDRIDHFVVSHNDADHIGGNAAIIEHYETEAQGIGAVYDPGIAASTRTYGEYLDAVEEYGVPLFETREGDDLPFAGVTVRVLGPPEPYLENEARNENSIVLRLAHGRTSVLLPGDAEDDQEAYLVEEYGESLRSTVLKAGHHGSASSSGDPFLDAVSPRAVVVSSAYDSQYGHPDAATLDRLAARSLPTYWTATHGHVVLASDGRQVTVRTQRAAPTDPASLRQGTPVEPGTADPVAPRATLGGDGTVPAAPSQTPSPTAATDGWTTTAAPGALAVDDVNADAAGDDRENLNDEFVTFSNTGDGPLPIGGWTVGDAAGKSYTVPAGTTIAAGATVTLHTGEGTDTVTDLYWGLESPVWNNDGDTVTVRTADGTTVLTEAYS